MTYRGICESVERLKKVYDETDPFRLCKAMGIIVVPKSMGTAPDAIKGFFVVHRRIRTIIVNSDLPLVIQRIIIAHELGHAVLHKDCGVVAFHDIGLFHDSSMFAAEFLMGDDDVLDVLNRDTTFFSAASQLCVPMELLDFKFRIMKWKGYKLVEPPIMSKSNFLRDMEVPWDEDV